ncbi:hypothetical protein F4775DRAFT_558052 [Biscogniauxia sp. FL1348]|nr:hypothetical protein F4775DRAFT_558052 [Biscogniauxia sp. FL1348]
MTVTELSSVPKVSIYPPIYPSYSPAVSGCLSTCMYCLSCLDRVSISDTRSLVHRLIGLGLFLSLLFSSSFFPSPSPVFSIL